MSAISVGNLNKTYAGGSSGPAVDDVSFEVAEGELVVLVGPSGCGKTTTLRCIAGLETPTSGRISIGDSVVVDTAARVDVPVHRRDIGLVFQTYALWPHLTARRNIEFPLECRRVGRAERAVAVESIARTVDLTADHLKRRPAQLSGGQQQRVALARALVANARVVLFDEPLSNLDAALREQLRSDLGELHRRLGFTGVYVTHDLDEAMMLGDRVAVMVGGRLRQIEPPEVVFEHPSSREVAHLVGLRLLGEAEWRDGGYRAEGIEISGLAPPRDGDRGPYALLVRPERVAVRPTTQTVGGGLVHLGVATVQQTSYLGTRREVVVELGGRRIRLGAPSDGAGLEVGQAVVLTVEPHHVRVFGVDGAPVDLATTPHPNGAPVQLIDS